MGGSGLNPELDADQSSASSCPLEELAILIVRVHVLIVEDNEMDVFLIEEAIEAQKAFYSPPRPQGRGAGQLLVFR